MRRKHRLRWVAVAALSVVAGAGLTAWLGAERIQERLRSALEKRLAASLGGSVRIGRLELRPLRLEAEIQDVDLFVPAGQAPPLTASLAHARVRLAWRGLVGLPAGRIHLSELTVRRPVLSVSFEFLRSRGGGEARWRPVDLRVERLRITEGVLLYDDRRLPLELQAEEVDVRAAWEQGRRALGGEASFTARLTARPFELPYPVRTRTRFRLRGTRLEFEGLKAEGPGLWIELDGQVVPLDEGVGLAAGGRVGADLDSLSERLRKDLPRFGGTLSGTVRLDRESGPVRFSGRLSAVAPVLGELRAARAQADAEYRDGHLSLRGLRAQAYGGVVTGEVDVVLEEETRFDARLEAEGAELEALLRLAGRPLPFASRARLGVELRGETGRPASWNGRGTLEALADRPTEGKLPLGGPAEFVLRDGRLTGRASSVRVAATDLDLGLDLDLGATPTTGSVTLEGLTLDAERTREGAEILLASFGVRLPDFLRLPVHGAGSLRARVGIGGEADLDLEVALADGSWDDQPFRTGRIDVGLRGGRVELRNVESELLPGGELAATGSLVLDPLHAERMSVEVRRVPVGAWTGRFVPGLRIDGALSGHLEVAEGEEGVQGEGAVELGEGSVLGEPFESFEAGISVRGAVVTAPDATLRSAAGEATGRIRLDLGSGAWAVELERGTVDLSRLETLRQTELDAKGEIRLSGAIHDSDEGLEGEFRLEGSEWSLKGLGLGSVQGTVNVSPDRVDVDLDPAQGSEWALQATVRTEEDLPVSASLRLDRAVVSLVDEARSMIEMTGEARIEGSLANVKDLRGVGVLERAQIRVESRLLQTVSAVPLRVEARELHFGPVRLEGPLSKIEGSLRLELESGGLEASLRGELDLGLLATAVPEVEASGRAQVDLRITGTAASPALDGTVEVRDGRVRSAAFPEPLERIDLLLRMRGQEADVERMSARLGGGEVRGTGALIFDGLRLVSYGAELDFSNVRAAYPEGFTAGYEGTLLLRGEPERAVLSGNLNLLRGIYGQDFAVGNIFSRSREYAAVESRELPPVELDLVVTADGNVWVQNAEARVEMGVDLHIGGDLDRPEVTGQILALEGGIIKLRGVEYRVTSASLDFAELGRIHPFLDLRAETRVRNYEIYLRIEGTLDRFDYQLTSNPSLPAQDIIALLTTGNTLEDLSGAASQAGTGPLTGDLAASYFAGSLLERQLQRVLPLERIRIDPLLVSEQADPTARITLGKRVSKNLFLVYSTNLGSTERQLYEVDWQASRKIRVSAERDTTGGIGADLLYSSRFAFGGSGADSAAAAAEPAQRVRLVEIEGTHDREEESDLRKSLVLEPEAPYRRSTMFEDAETIRRYLVRHGRIEARVEAAGVPVSGEPGRTDVEYTIHRGPLVAVEIQGLAKKERRRFEEALKDFWVDSVFTYGLYEQAEEFVRRHFRSRGHYAVDAEVQVEGDETERTVRFLVEPGAQVRVDSIRIEGPSEVAESRVRRQMLTREGTLVSKGLLDPQVLAQDVLAIRNLYEDQGFLEARVEEPHINLSTAADAASVTLVIHEGPRFTVGSVETVDTPPFSARELQSWTGLKEGEVFSPKRLGEAEDALRSRLDSLGYPEARVAGRVELSDHRAQVGFDVRPGGFKRVGAVEISGNRRTRQKIIRREVLLGPGDPASREKIIESQHRLFRLGIFRNVRVTYEPMAGADDPALQVMRVHVEEAPPIGLTLGGGYDTEGKARGSFSVADENLGGYGRSLAFQGRASSIERRLQLLARERRLFARDLDALVNLFWERREEVGFTVERRSTALRVERKFKPGWAGFVRYNYQRVDLFDVRSASAVQEQNLEDVRLGDVGYTVARDTRDDPFQPTRGGYASAEVRLFAPVFLSDESFVKVFLQGSTTHTFRNGTAFASALRIGAADTYGSSISVPLSERFFAGGESTLRGFPRDEVGPSAEGQPSGGEALFVLNEEFRFPIYRQLKGVVFYDAGNVYETITQFDPADLRHVLGVGLRLETPIGPIRLEYGRKLDREPGESRGQFYVAIGSAF